jgi:hypothetical protein
MNRRLLFSLLCSAGILFAAPSANADDWFDIHAIWRSIVKVFCPPKPHYDCDPRLVHAAAIAESRAHPKKTWRCWRYVKDALVESGVISKRPKSPWAKEAGEELCGKFGFTKIPVRNPYDAPVGAVIVYGGPDAGHVELRSSKGFVSDFISKTPYPRPLIGVYVKT